MSTTAEPQAKRSDLLRSAAYFPVGDVTAAGAHYRDILGFLCEYTGGEPPEFALYSRGACSIMLRRVGDPSLVCPNEKQGGTWDVFVWVADLDALYEELTAAGATIVYPPQQQPYGMREFAVRDAAGYVLGFGQECAG